MAEEHLGADERVATATAIREAMETEVRARLTKILLRFDGPAPTGRFTEEEASTVLAEVTGLLIWAVKNDRLKIANDLDRMVAKIVSGDAPPMTACELLKGMAILFRELAGRLEEPIATAQGG